MENEKTTVDWVIHVVANGAPCADCGKVENNFPEYVCDAHTHGMAKYGHYEFQTVLFCGMKEIGRLFNTLGLRVQAGEKFKSGDKVSGLYEDCDVTLLGMLDSSGVPILRLVIPDKEYRMPWDNDVDYPYSMQNLATNFLYRLGKESDTKTE